MNAGEAKIPSGGGGGGYTVNLSTVLFVRVCVCLCVYIYNSILKVFEPKAALQIIPTVQASDQQG